VEDYADHPQHFERVYGMGTEEELKLDEIFSKHIEPRNALLAKEKKKAEYKDIATGRYSELLWEGRWKTADGAKMNKAEIYEAIL
jgi:hypothetical protein